MGLCSYTGWQQLLPPPLPEIIDREEEWVVEEILNSKMMNWKLQYLVKWKDFGTKHNTWEPWVNVHAPELVTDSHWRIPGAARHIQMAEFNLIKFRFVPTNTAPGCHFSKGGEGLLWVPLTSSMPCLPSVPSAVSSPKYILPHHHHPIILPSTPWPHHFAIPTVICIVFCFRCSCFL